MYSESMLSLFGQIKALHHLIHEGCETFDAVYERLGEELSQHPKEVTAPLREASQLYASMLHELSSCVQQFTTLVTSPAGLREEAEGFEELLSISSQVLGRMVVTLRQVESDSWEEEQEMLSKELNYRIAEMKVIKEMAESVQENALTPTVTFDA